MQIFLFTSRENNLFFGDQRLTIFFFMFCRRNFLSYVSLIMYVTILCFFWSTHFSSISTTNFFVLPTFSTNFFFLIFVATNYFFQYFSRPPPRPQISNGASLRVACLVRRAGVSLDCCCVSGPGYISMSPERIRVTSECTLPVILPPVV